MDDKRYLVVNRDWELGNALQVVDVMGGSSGGWLDPRYVDKDTGSARHPEIVRSRL